jgi:hypothetical protein
MSRDEFLEYAKEFLRRSIAKTLKIEKQLLIEDVKAQTAVERCLVTVMTIAKYKALDEAIAELWQRYSSGGEPIPRRDVEREVNACYNTFRVEVDGLTTMHQITRPLTEPKELWSVLRERIPLEGEYDDDWIQVADAWILRGETLNKVVGTATLKSFINAEDEAAFVEHLLRLQDNKAEKQGWPREVCIRRTLESIAAELGDDYSEDDENGLVATAIMESMHTIEIESWEEVPEGYELFDQQDKDDRECYLRSREDKDPEAN